MWHLSPNTHTGKTKFICWKKQNILQNPSCIINVKTNENTCVSLHLITKTLLLHVFDHTYQCFLTDKEPLVIKLISSIKWSWHSSNSYFSRSFGIFSVQFSRFIEEKSDPTHPTVIQPINMTLYNGTWNTNTCIF